MVDETLHPTTVYQVVQCPAGASAGESSHRSGESSRRASDVPCSSPWSAPPPSRTRLQSAFPDEKLYMKSQPEVGRWFSYIEDLTHHWKINAGMICTLLIRHSYR